MIQETTYIIYHTTPTGPQSNMVHNLVDALRETSALRDRAAAGEDIAFITMVGENINRVGKDGVDEVKDGKTPDGVPYTWNKASRIGATKR